MNRISGNRFSSLLFDVFALTLAVCGITRIVLKLNFMDPETGLYLTDTALIHLFHFGLLIGSVVLFGAVYLHRPKAKSNSTNPGPTGGVLCLLTGVSMAAYVLLESSLYPVIDQGYSQMIISIRQFIGVALGVLSGAVMVWLGVGIFRGKVSQYAVYPALLPAVWQVYLLITRFNGLTVVTTITDNLLALLFMAAASLFLVAQARTVLAIPRQDNRSFTASTGLCTALFGFLLVLPNFIWMIVNQQIDIPAPTLGPWESVYVLVSSLYGLVFAVHFFRSVE